MRLDVLRYDRHAGWTPRPLPPGDGRDTLLLLFGSASAGLPSDAFTDLAQAYPDATLAGCSTEGEILDGRIEEGGLVAALLRFDDTPIRSAWAPLERASDSFDAGRSLARDIFSKDLHGVLVLADGLCVNGSELVRGLNDVLPRGVTVAGGLAGDGARFQRTWVLAGGRPEPGMACAIGLLGDRVRLAHARGGGWRPFGPERLVTRSRGSVLHEMDGRPALDLYEEYLGALSTGLPAAALRFPLALRAGRGNGDGLVRTVLSIDARRRTMTFAGDVPEGCVAHMMFASAEHLLGSATTAAQAVGRAGRTRGPSLALAVSCVGRRLLLGERAEEEPEATLDALPRGTRQIGFYSHGEFSSAPDGGSDLHNQTLTLTTIGEVA